MGEDMQDLINVFTIQKIEKIDIVIEGLKSGVERAEEVDPSVYKQILELKADEAWNFASIDE